MNLSQNVSSNHTIPPNNTFGIWNQKQKNVPEINYPKIKNGIYLQVYPKKPYLNPNKFGKA